MNSGEPLGIPKGSVRAIAMLMLLVSFVVGEIMLLHHFLNAEQYELAMAVYGLLAAETSGALAFYFGTRVAGGNG